MKNYDVHIFLPLRIKVKNIQAKNQLDAIEVAKHKLEGAISSNFDPLNISIINDQFEAEPDYDADYIEFFVDEHNNPEYLNSKWYTQQELSNYYNKEHGVIEK